MRLCMFHPVDHPMERGWVGRIDGEHVVHLAAQTLQAFFTGGASAREHAVYPLEAVRLLAPVLHPPSVRVFEHQTAFEFANPAAIVGPGAEIRGGRGPRNSLLQGGLTLSPRLAALVGAEGALAGFTAFADWRNPASPPPKDRDFALGLGPVVLTPDAIDLGEIEVVVRVDDDERLRLSLDPFDWEAARRFAAEGTVLHPGDVLAGAPAGSLEDIEPGQTVDVVATGIRALRQVVGPRD